MTANTVWTVILCYVILSTCHFVTLAFHQLEVLPTWHSVKLLIHQLVIRSCCKFTNFPSLKLSIHWLVISWTWHFATSSFRKFANSIKCHFINFSFHQLVIWFTCHFTNFAIHNLLHKKATQIKRFARSLMNTTPLG